MAVSWVLVRVGALFRLVLQQRSYSYLVGCRLLQCCYYASIIVCYCAVVLIVAIIIVLLKHCLCVLLLPLLLDSWPVHKPCCGERQLPWRAAFVLPTGHYLPRLLPSGVCLPERHCSYGGDRSIMFSLSTYRSVVGRFWYYLDVGDGR